MVGDYRRSFSRPSSDESEDSEDTSSVEEQTTSSMNSAGKDSIATEWTDEKHSLYLKSMEASFVDQLYNSIGALVSNRDKENVPEIGSSRKFSSSRKPSEEQFKVLRDGFWKKTNVKQPEYRLNGRHEGGSHEFLRSPWIKHYKSLPKTQNPVTDEPENQVVSSNGKKEIVICCSDSASSLKQMLKEGCSHSRERDQISIGEEVSDQNFVNEVTKGENGSSKKMKIVTSGSSSTDQIVSGRRRQATSVLPRSIGVAVGFVDQQNG